MNYIGQMLKAIPAILMLMIIGLAAAADGPVDRHAAVRALAKRASDGDAKALYDLASLHDTGYDTVPLDSARSTLLYRLSAEKGYPPAQSYLGYRYFMGEAVGKDVDSALYWLAKAAGNGDARAANNLGYLLTNGEAVTQDFPQAFYWLTKAADAGLPAAESQLADLYRLGAGTDIDTVKAAALYFKAFGKGLADAELKLLSMMARKWEGLPGDSAVKLGRYYYTSGAYLTGVTLFGYAARECNPEALALLGDAYSKGRGVDYDHDRATAYFLAAALRGEPSAQFVIAELLDIFPDALSSGPAAEVIKGFYQELDVPGDLYIPSYWYGKAAEQGVTDAEKGADRMWGREY